MAAVLVPGCPSCWSEGLRFVVLHVPRVWTALRGGLSALTDEANASICLARSSRAILDYLPQSQQLHHPGSGSRPGPGPGLDSHHQKLMCLRLPCEALMVTLP